MRVLAGDIGGTKTLLAIAECAGGRCRVIAQRRFDSVSYPGLAEMLKEFLAASSAEASGIRAACFAVAGPVMEKDGGQYTKVTNLPWEAQSADIAHAFGIAKVRLINDFQGVSYGIEALGAQDLVALQPGRPQERGTRAVLGAGTGLGQGVLVWCDGRYEALATEGGHVDFAPVDELQDELLRHFRRRYGRVSAERVISGSGLAGIYGFFRERDRSGAPGTVSTDPADISAAALAGSDPVAVRALDLFVRLYGAHAGNLALTVLATGGVYIAGGIAPKIIAKLKDVAFLDAFNDKGRMRALAETMPVHVVMNPDVGLLGAVLVASRL
jgi:glucokinase